MRKINYLIWERYPTEKAYGVTIGNSLAALVSMGIEAKIITLAGDSSKLCDEFGNEIIRIGNNTHVSNLKFGWASMPDTLRSIILEIYFLLKLLPVVKRNRNEIFWTRNRLVATLLSVLNVYCVVLEIHQFPNRFTRAICNFVRKNNFILAGITPEHLRVIKYRFPEIKTVTLPMGVPEEFFQTARLDQPDKEIIGYIGKSSSSGHDNNLGSIIGFFKHRLDNFELMIIGVEEIFELKAKNIIEAKDIFGIQMVKHVNFNQIFDFLGKFTIGLVPYPDTNYHQSRFPIKTLEYAASGVTLLIAESKALRNLIGDDKAYYYDGNSVESFWNVVENIHSDTALRLKKRHAAQLWAKQFTYAQRVEKLLEAIQSQTT